MKPRLSWRLLGSAVVLGIGLMAPQSSEGTTVTGTFRYDDTVSPTCNTAYCLQPIAYTQVEVWHRGTMSWDIWVPIGQATTDATGRFTFSDARSWGTYSVRVFAVNYAARVGPGGMDWFYAVPGSPWTNLNHSVSWPDQVVDFSWDFISYDRLSVRFFNIAETVRRGFDYAGTRRDPRETDPLVRASIVMTDDPMNPADASWYNPIWHEVVLHTRDAQNDLIILHEYAHWLEAQLSSFAWIPSSHGTCIATAFGLMVNSPEHAWMEGFADYFARAVPSFLPARTLDIWPGADVLETPMDCTVAAADAIENRIAVSLWDLFDPWQPAELHDFVSGADVAIFQIFDRELDTFGHHPTIWDFRNAWAARAYDLPGLDRMLSHHGILYLPRQTAQFAGASAPAEMIVGTAAAVSVRMRNTGANIWKPEDLHRLGSQGPQDNAIWGTVRVGLPVASVLPGEYVTFSFTARAPSTPGTYNFQWQMLEETREWFGDLSAARAIRVISNTPPDPDGDPDLGPDLCFDPIRRKLVPCG